MPVPITFTTGPTRNFPLVARPLVWRPTGAVVWNPQASHGNFSLSYDRLTAKATGKADAVDNLLRANISASIGYLEIVVNTVASGTLIGLTDSTQSTTDYVGDTHGTGYQNTGSVVHAGSLIATYATYTTGDVIGICRKGNFLYFSKNGVWQNSADPSAGTGGIDVSAYASDVIFPAVSTEASALNITASFTAASMVYTIPTGVTAWDGTTVSVSSVNGTLANTLANVTLSTTANLLIKGSVTKTLGAVTLSSVGNLKITGTLSKTLDNVTDTDTANLLIKGSLNKTFGNVTLVSNGSSRVSATLSKTLATLSISSTATLKISGSLSASLGTLSGTEQGHVLLKGSLAASLGSVSCSSTGTLVLGILHAISSNTLGTISFIGIGKLGPAVSTSLRRKGSLGEPINTYKAHKYVRNGNGYWTK